MDSITKTELEVAEILRILPKLFRKRSRRRVPFDNSIHWGTKKKRSIHDKRNHLLSSCSPPPPLPPPPRIPSSGLLPKQTVVKAASLSPSSPLSFYQSGAEETDHNTSGLSASPGSRRSKKAKVRNKEWIIEQNETISTLCEVNRKLQQEAADTRKRYETLFAENTRLKQTKSMLESEQERIDRRHQLVPISILISPVGPSGPNTAPGHQEENRSRPEVVIEPPPPPPPRLIDQKQQRQINHYSSQDQVEYHPWSVGVGEPRIPDLNTRSDDNGFVPMDHKWGHQKKQVMIMEQQCTSDAKKTATAEARKKRLEINRKKAAAVVGRRSCSSRAGVLFAR